MPSCIHFPDDPNAVCTMCKPKPGFDAWEPEAPDGIEARYNGTCDACGGTIYVGDLIRAYGDGWKHVDCRG